MRDFELTLEIKNDAFIRPPREAQRNWLLNTAMSEFAADLDELDRSAMSFVRGRQELRLEDREQTDLCDDEIMEDWQIPLMEAMARAVTGAHGDILEIGFGRGIASTLIQEQGVRSHTIIECNKAIVQRFEKWRAVHGDRDIRMVAGKWQDVLDGLPEFDGVFFHTYPLNETELIEQIGESITFAAHFFPHAADHLVDGGVFTYLSNEIDSLSRSHQRLLLRHFTSL